jgi:regulator of nucleoside diphosphate kinase
MSSSAPAIEPAPAPIVITAFDQRRLRGLVDVLRKRGGADDAYLEDLEMEIERAEVVEPTKVPASVVTMNSTVVVQDAETGEKTEVTVVFPGKAHADSHCISVLAPMGAALLGARVGQRVRWATPRRRREAKVVRVVYQPEASGHFDR